MINLLAYSDRHDYPLMYTNPNLAGRNEVRFDGYDTEADLLIDRKINVAGSKKALNQVDRQAEALRQNELEAKWQVPDEKIKRKAEKLLEKQGAEDVITVEVVPELWNMS